MDRHQGGPGLIVRSWRVPGERSMLRYRLKDDRGPQRVVIERQEDAPLDFFAGIRCPACGWRPGADSRWSCEWSGPPEPPFDSCGTVWNTFATHGRCPGCSHQWLWTSCLRCEQWSPHADWYVEDDAS